MTPGADPLRLFNARGLLIATTNQGKIREISSILHDRLPSILTLRDLPGIEPPAETGSTFRENAEAKALFYATAAGLPCLADDSGLEVEALAGRPGVLSARYGDENATDRDRNATLLAELAGMAPGNRRARFVCHLALADAGQLLYSVEGDLRGRVADAPRGKHGFGYDPIFIPESDTRTIAEMTDAEKNLISHRAEALRKLRALLITAG